VVNSRTILLVSDQAEFRDSVAFVLRRRGYRVEQAASAVEAESWLAQNVPDLLLVEMMLPDRSGFQVLRLAKERFDEQTPAIMMSGHASGPHRDYAFAAGANLFLPKPFTLAQLYDSVGALCPLPRQTSHRVLARIGAG
jgi:DNA-binding response OmpR family regulator